MTYIADNIFNILAVLIGFTTLFITFIAIGVAIITFYMGKKHSEQYDEIDKIRSEYNEAVISLNSSVTENKKILQEVRLGFSTITELLILEAKKDVLKRTFEGKDKFKDKLNDEMNIIDKSVHARMYEIRMLSDPAGKSTYATQALAKTFGDEKTISFLNQIAQLENTLEKSTEIGKIIGQIQARAT